jgi:hypothetical protein
MNQREMKNKKAAMEAAKQQIAAETKKPYDFSGVKIVNDIPDGSYRAYIINMTLTKQYATLRLYMKPLLETNPEPIRLTYCIGLGDNSFTQTQTSNIMLQLNKTGPEYKCAVESFWNDYPALINDGIADGLTYTEAKLHTLERMPKWYSQGKYEDLGTVLCTASHYQSKLRLDFNESKVKQKLKNVNTKVYKQVEQQEQSKKGMKGGVK